MGGDARVEDVGARQPLAGQGEVGADGAGHPGEEEGGADVGEEADGRLGHGEDGALGCDAEGGVDAEADTAAHGDAVHEGDVGLVEGGDQVVQLVFLGEVLLGQLLALLARLVPLGQLGDVAASTKRLVPCALHNDDIGHVRLGPLEHARGDLADHGAIEGVELLGAVELDGAEAVEGVEEDILGFVAVAGLEAFVGCFCRHLGGVSVMEGWMDVWCRPQARRVVYQSL